MSSMKTKQIRLYLDFILYEVSNPKDLLHIQDLMGFNYNDYDTFIKRNKYKVFTLFNTNTDKPEFIFETKGKMLINIIGYKNQIISNNIDIINKIIKDLKLTKIQIHNLYRSGLCYSNKIQSLSQIDKLNIDGNINLSRLEKNIKLPSTLTVSGDFIANRSPIIKLPDNLTIGNRFSIDQTKISSLPKNLSVVNSIYIRDTEITELPKNFIANKDLYISIGNISRLPENLVVKGILYLSSHRNFHVPFLQLPKKYKVGAMDIPITIEVDLTEKDWENCKVIRYHGNIFKTYSEYKYFLDNFGNLRPIL